MHRCGAWRVETVIRILAGLGCLAGVLMLLGCEVGDGSVGGGGGPSGGPGGGNVEPGSGNLENRTFTFADGAAFGLDGQAVTLTFGDFDTDGDTNPSTGPVTLQVTATGGTATGTATVGSLDMTFSQSTDIPEIPPGTPFSFDATLDADGRLNLTNTDTSASSSSDPTSLIPATDVAFVITTDFSTGSYSVVDLDSRATFNDIFLGGVHSDATARFFNGLVYVINRGGDNIQILDPQQGFITVTQVSMGDGCNPQDIAVVNPDKAYVSCLGSAELLIVDPTTLAQLDIIDLTGRTRPNDADGVPELFRMRVHNGLVYLILQHLDFTTGAIPAKASPGEVVVIDPETDTVVTVIQLQGTNPNTDLQLFSRGPDFNRLLVGSVGDFLVDDGGIEAINPDTSLPSLDPAGFVITEGVIGGDITHFDIVSEDKAFAVITDEDFDNSLVTFNPSTGQRINVVLEPQPVFMPHFAINSRQELYLAVTDLATLTPGLRIFDAVQDVELTPEPLSVGQLPPFYVLFIEP